MSGRTELGQVVVKPNQEMSLNVRTGKDETLYTQNKVDRVRIDRALGCSPSPLYATHQLYMVVQFGKTADPSIKQATLTMSYEDAEEIFKHLGALLY